ncbi:MAG: hypothetical protein J6Q68_01460 [Clostridia bacterium]|nr:hypothetical protein [Clostridia bacterium]
MKKRRLAVVAFMLIAVLTIGVGYAALTDLLTIRGSVEINSSTANVAFDEKIYFETAEITKGVSKDSGAAIYDSAAVTNDPDIANFTANTLADSHSELIFTYTVKNDSDHAAAITVEANMAGQEGANPSNSNANYFDIKYVIGDGANNVVAADGGTITVTITVTLKDGVTPPTSGSVTASYVLELTATSVAE